MSSVFSTCQNCKREFTVEPEDFDFYKKISVPPPTWCPNCRFQRRLVFFNLFNLYKRKCDLCGKDSISLFHPGAPYTVYCAKCWWSDNWDPLSYGRDYDFSKPFFEQLNELWHTAPLLGLSIDPPTLASSPYCNDAGNLKNSYLIFHANDDEDCAYGLYVGFSKSLVDCSAIVHSEMCYDSMHSYKANHCIGSRHQIAESLDCIFCRDCVNCQNCFGSANLRNKKYYFFNEPCTKEEYFRRVKQYDLGSYATYKKVQRMAEEHWKTLPGKSEYNEFVDNCSGPNVFNSKNVKESIEVQNAEDSKWLFMMWQGTRGCYDISTWGDNFSESYECCVVGEDSSRVRFAQEAGTSLFDADYCKLSVTASHHFGCVSVRKKDYCILNKQYSKDGYAVLRSKIIEHMNDMPYTDNRGNVYRYGEFLPPEMSTFAYNETLAQNFFPLTKEQAFAKHYRWRDIEISKHSATLETNALPDHIKDVTDNILNETIKCPSCPRAFRIIKMELDFLRYMNVPLPRECPMCRIQQKLDLWVKNQERNPRKCSRCGKAFESKYRESEPVVVLCRECYLQEVV
ncbi:MAG: hypothetical protein V2A55_00095 [Candidatus Jorgensenbacteria bacterium]